MTDVTALSDRHETAAAATTDRDGVALVEPTSPQLIYTVREAATVLRIGYSTAREHIRTGELRSFKIGGRRLIAGEDLVAFVRCQREQGIGFNG